MEIEETMDWGNEEPENNRFMEAFHSKLTAKWEHWHRKNETRWTLLGLFLPTLYTIIKLANYQVTENKSAMGNDSVTNDHQRILITIYCTHSLHYSCEIIRMEYKKSPQNKNF